MVRIMSFVLAVLSHLKLLKPVMGNKPNEISRPLNNALNHWVIHRKATWTSYAARRVILLVGVFIFVIHKRLLAVPNPIAKISVLFRFSR